MKVLEKSVDFFFYLQQKDQIDVPKRPDFLTYFGRYVFSSLFESFRKTFCLVAFHPKLFYLWTNNVLSKFPQAQINGFVKNPFGCADVGLGYYSTNISPSWFGNSQTIHSLSDKY